MGKARAGMIVILVVSLALGALSGWVFYRIFLSNIPPAALSSFTRATAPLQFVGYGLLLGLVLFGWTLAAVALARRSGRGGPGASGGTTSSGRN